MDKNYLHRVNRIRRTVRISMAGVFASLITVMILTSLPDMPLNVHELAITAASAVIGFTAIAVLAVVKLFRLDPRSQFGRDDDGPEPPRPAPDPTRFGPQMKLFRNLAKEPRRRVEAE